MSEKKRFGIIIALVFLILGYFYLLPASQLMLEGDRGHLMSDGGDPTPIPFHFYAIIDAFKNHPLRLLFGAVYTSQMNPPDGFALWIPFVDRFFTLIYAPFVPVEAMISAIIWSVMCLNGIFLYLLGRKEGWHRGICLALGICFAFNPFVRARAVAHGSLAEIFYLPAIFLALRIAQDAIQTGKRKFYLQSTLLLLLCAMVAHYHVMIMVALVPFFLIFFLRRFTLKKVPVAFLKLTVIALPAFLFLVFSLKFPVPPGLASEQTVHKPPIAYNYLTIYAARPVDYLTGDVGLGNVELNPVKRALGSKVLSNLDWSNPIERSNGIRWFILLASALGLLLSLIYFRRSSQETKAGAILFFFVFSVWAYLCSMAPLTLSLGGQPLTPSHWIHQLMPNFRVPSRFGPAFHFGLLMMTGYTLHVFFQKRQSLKRAAWILPVLAVLEYPPLARVWMSPTSPARTSLVDYTENKNGECGAGMHFPYYLVHPVAYEGPGYYSAVQQLRHTPCSLIQQPADTEMDRKLLRKFGKEAFEAALKVDNARTLKQDLISFIQCSQIEWIVFRNEASESWMLDICQTLGWQRVSQDSCRAPKYSTRLKSWNHCL